MVAGRLLLLLCVWPIQTLTSPAGHDHWAPIKKQKSRTKVCRPTCTNRSMRCSAAAETDLDKWFLHFFPPFSRAETQTKHGHQLTFTPQQSLFHFSFFSSSPSCSVICHWYNKARKSSDIPPPYSYKYIRCWPAVFVGNRVVFRRSIRFFFCHHSKSLWMKRSRAPPENLLFPS